MKQDLDIFREAWNGFHVMQYDNELVYRTVRGFSDKAARRANELIAELGLDLEAIPTDLLAKDSFHVKKPEKINPDGWVDKEMDYDTDV